MLTEIGKQLKLARTYNQITQARLAKHLKLSSPQYISNVERGLCVMNPRLFRKTAKLLNMGVVWFLWTPLLWTTKTGLTS